MAPTVADRIGRAAHLLLAAGAPADAEEIFRQALALRPQAADLHLGLSLSLAGQGLAAEALAAAAEGHAVAPGHTDLASHYGHLLHAAGQAHSVEAEAVFRSVLARAPMAGRALHGLSMVLAARDALAEATALANRAVVRLPAQAEVPLWRARLNLRGGNAPQAERQFRALTRIAPDRAEAPLGWADAPIARERRDEAIAVLRRALETWPGDVALAERLRQITPPAPAATPRPGFIGRLRGLVSRARRGTGPRRPGS